MDPDSLVPGSSLQPDGFPPGVDLHSWLEHRPRAGDSSFAPTADRSRGPGVQPPEPRNRVARHRSRTGSDHERGTDRARRAAAYLAKLPPAVSGERGHNRTYQAACILVQGFDLSIDEARPILEDWNQACQPPWSKAELEHKLADAARDPGRKPRGWLLQAGQADAPKARSERPGEAGQPSGTEDAARAPTQPDIPPGAETNPHRLAALILEQEFLFTGSLGLRYWRDEFHVWDGAAYHAVPSGEIRARATRALAREFDRVYRRALEDAAARPKPGPPPRPIPVSARLVSDVIQALASLVMVSVREVPSQPAWLAARPDLAAGAFENDSPGWAAVDVLPARNALIHLPSLMAGTIRRQPPTPNFFNAFALDYDFDDHAPEPAAWLNFLAQIWPNDSESVQCLQEWFGYLLTPDTRQQKILMMVGPKRSGRGTIARILKALAGESTVVNPTLGTLARPFGLAPLIGKPIAVFPDARLSSRPDNAAIVECLLSISGEDDQTIDRKHLPAWTGKLPTRFVLISNELPRLRDVSGALAGRLIILRFTQSFYGREDLGLLDRLHAELPGILRWAIAGWERLNRRGRFTQPRSARELVATMDELASPIAAFLRERCVQEPDASCAVASLYEAWRSWCHEHGRDAVGDEHSFGRDLHAAIPGLVTTRPRTPEGRVRLYQGLRLRTPLDPDPDAEHG